MRTFISYACASLLTVPAAFAQALTEGEAQPPEAAAPSEGSAPPAALCESADPTTAEINSREGVRLAKAGQFLEAVPLFRIAARLDACSPDYLLLLARALARSNERAEALQRYQEVIDSFPQSLAARRAEKERAELEAQPEESPQAEALTAVDSDWPLIGAITAGGGAALALGGMFFAFDAQSADDDLYAASRRPDRRAYDDLVSRRKLSSTLAYTFYGVGGAAVAAGAALFFFGDDLFGPSAPSAVVSPTPEGGVSLQFGGRF